MNQKEIEALYQNQGLDRLEQHLKISFKNKSNLVQAFTHRSFLNEHPSHSLENNERLEFLGDAALEMIVTEYLFRQYSNPEGRLTRWRAALVKTDSLALVAEQLSFSDYLLLSKGERQGPTSRSLLADTLEAFIGALYLDQGLETTRQFINSQILVRLPEIIESAADLDAKSELQELIQSRQKGTLNYQVLETQGPDHKKQFKVGVFLSDQMIGSGSGRSKQAAEQVAAAQALKSLK